MSESLRIWTAKPRRAVSILALGTLLMGLPGCMENIALFPRPALPEVQTDVVGSVERLDSAGRWLHLRPNAGERRVLAYSNDARVLYRGREYPMSRLAPGDVVAVQLKRDARGESYVDLVRIERESVGDPGIREETLMPSAIETLSGTVQRVNRRDNSFEIDNQPSPIVITLSDYVRDSDRERFQTLQSGDHVRFEGKFLSRNRFEMLSFLNNEY